MPTYKAGAVAVRTGRKGPEFFLVTAKKNPDRWIFPKGSIERGETAADAAVRELREEGGISGELVAPLTAITLGSGADAVEISYFLVRYLGDAEAEDERDTRWLGYKKARKTLFFEESKHVLDGAMQAISAW